MLQGVKAIAVGQRKQAPLLLIYGMVRAWGVAMDEICNCAGPGNAASLVSQLSARALPVKLMGTVCSGLKT